MIVADSKTNKLSKIPTLGNAIVNWDAPCHEQELIRWKLVVEDNFKINKTANNLSEDIAQTDSIDIFPDTSGNINNHARDVQVDNVYQEQKSQAFTYITIYPISLQGRNTGPAWQVKCRIDSGAGANVISLDDYKKVNPSAFDDAGNSLVGSSNDRITLKAYYGTKIKQYGSRALNCQ